MTNRARLRMALPPGWAALNKDLLLAALEEGFVSLDDTEGALMNRLRDAEVHLVAFSPSPITGKPQAILSATIVDDSDNALGIAAESSEGWLIDQWSGDAAPGLAEHISRAARSFAVGEEDERGLISLYEIGFGSGNPGALVTILMKLHRSLTDEAVAVLDEIASTVSVEPQFRQ